MPTARLKAVFLLLALPFLTTCKNGATSLPELGNALVRALSSGSEGKFAALIPTAQQVEDFYGRYLWDWYENEAAARKEGQKVAARMIPKLKEEFNSMVRMSKTAGFEAKKMKGSMTGVAEHSKTKGFSTGNFQMQAADGKTYRNLYSEAVMVDGRWFIWEKLHWRLEKNNTSPQGP